jgi:hypothetical protein
MPYFTNRDIVFLPPGRYQLTGAKGLYLIVTEDEQVRRWVYRYTSPVRKKVTDTGLGLFPAITIDDARDKAADLRRQVAHGIDPVLAKRAERASQVTFREVAEAWIATRKPSWRSKSQEQNASLLLFNHGHALCKMPVASITRDHVQKALEALWAKYPRQARRALAMIKRVLDFAKAKGYRTGDNPAEWNGRIFVVTSAEDRQATLCCSALFTVARIHEATANATGLRQGSPSVGISHRHRSANRGGTGDDLG